MSQQAPILHEETATPMAHRFFEAAIRGKSLAHAYMLKGHAYGAMYNTALTIARIINCKTPRLDALLDAMACGMCTDCRWVAQNAHPAVLTISRHTYQVGDKGEDLDEDAMAKLAKKATPTQIKTEQIERLIRQLGLSSEYERVVIFTDGEELPATIPTDITPPYEWQTLKTSAEKSFHIRPIERGLFNAASANRFLKTLEEPPPRTLFFFITDNEEAMLETIVSRCQVVPFLLGGDDARQTTVSEEQDRFLSAWLSGFGPRADIYALGGDFQAFFTETEGLSTPQALGILQAWLHSRAENALRAPEGFQAYRAVQEAVSHAMQLINAKTHEAQSLVSLWLTLQAEFPRLRVHLG